ncbi:MAG: hypothetical protein PHZ00_03105 [Candidatus Peribacteraceae bacterium]|nr:hypothetical protein [Candidatus Peribacteraceae bacterium]
MHTVLHRFRIFAHQHDDVPAFHATFLVCTVLAAALFNLGFFLLLIIAHMALDFVKYRDVHHFNLRMTFKGMLLESIVDIALFLFSLTVGIYLSHAYFMTALSGLLRSEMTILRAFGTIVPKVRILENLACVLFNLQSYLHSIHPNLQVPLTRIQHWSLKVSYLCLMLLALSVLLFHGREITLLDILAHELIPAL